MKYSVKDFLNKCDPYKTVDLLRFTKEILNGKRPFVMHFR